LLIYKGDNRFLGLVEEVEEANPDLANIQLEAAMIVTGIPIFDSKDSLYKETG
jgi:phage tail protein X